MKKSIFTKIFVGMAIVVASTLVGCTNPSTSSNQTKYTITFDTNGGSAIAPIEVNKDAKVTKPANPSKENYVFYDWYKDNTTFNNVFTFNEPITSNITIYARWQLGTAGAVAEILQLSSSYLTYRENIKVKTGANAEDTYTNREELSYYVGDDNEFVLPVVASALSGQVVREYDKNIQLFVQEGTNYVEDSVGIYASKSTKGVTFKSTALGKTFKLKVTLTFDSTESVEIEGIKVFDGYNIYALEDLNNLTNYSTIYYNYQQNRKTIEANGYVLHNDIKVLKENLPQELILKTKESDADYQFSNNSLRDDAVIFYFDEKENVEKQFIGNFFSIDGSDLPYVVRDENTETSREIENGKLTGLAQVNTYFLKFGHTGNSAEGAKNHIKNLSIIGNSQYTDDIQAAGGFTVLGIGGNAGNATNLHVTFGNTGMNIDGRIDHAFTLTHSKVVDCFSLGMYVWGGSITNVSSSIFKKFGGPAFMSIDVNAGKTAGSRDPQAIVSSLNLTDNVIENFVTGEEAWFKINNATPLVGPLKGEMEDTVNQIGRSILKRKNDMDYMNFIAVQMAPDITAGNWPQLNFAINGKGYNFDSSLNLSLFGKNPRLETQTGGIFGITQDLSLLASGDTINLQTLVPEIGGGVAVTVGYFPKAAQ